MNEQQAFDRRRDTGNAPLPRYLHLDDHSECDHTPCSVCVGARIIKSNRDIERSSIWAYAQAGVA